MYTEYIQFLHIIFLKEIKNTDVTSVYKSYSELI